MWFSPDGLRVAYVKFNDTLVPDNPLLYHVRNHNGDPVCAYPHEVRLKYPKVGVATVDMVTGFIHAQCANSKSP